MTLIQESFQATPEDLEESSKVVTRHADKASLKVPSVLYHGSKREFNKFDLNHFGNTDDGYYGVGVYLAPDFEHANDYGWWVYQVHVRDPKPFFLWSSSSGGNAHQARIDIGDIPDYAHVKPRTDLPDGYEVVPYEKTDNYGHYETRQGFRVQPNEELQAAHLKATREEQAESDIRWGDFAETPEQAVTVFHDDGDHEYGWTSSMLKRLGRRDFAGVLQKHGYNCLCTYDEDGISEVLVFDPEDVVIDKVVNHPNKYDVYESSAQQLIERAFHGTPHTIKGNFCMSKVGTGEGAQAYGHGIYFTDTKAIAADYRDKLARWSLLTRDGTIYDDRKELKNINVRAVLNKDGDIDAAIARARAVIASIPGTQGAEYALADIATLEALKASGGLSKTDGNIYEVEIDATPEDLLDWDNPLSRQSAKVRAALKKAYEFEQYFDAPLEVDETGTTGNYYWYYQGDAYSSEREALESERTVGRLIPVDSKGAADRLVALGIPGIKYLDGNSRSEGKGSHNYVIFDPSIVRIIGTHTK